MTLIEQQSLHYRGLYIYEFRINDLSTMSVRDAIRLLHGANLANVPLIQPNYLFLVGQQSQRPAPAAANQTQQGDAAQYIVEKLKLGDVHRLATGNNVIIAVIDSEIDAGHPDLAGVVRQRFSAVGPEPPHPHGTGMAGAIASRQKLVGIAPNARLLAVHAFSSKAATAESTTFQILKGIDWSVLQGARIINMSFAGPRDPSLERALKAAYDRNVVLVAAAGNAGPKSPPLFPGADPNVIAVTATDVDDKLFPGANRGRYVAIAAPGVDILVPAPQDAYQLTTGTSVASAEVSGVVALMLERNPNLRPADVRRILTSTARRLGTATRDDNFGYGSGRSAEGHAGRRPAGQQRRTSALIGRASSGIGFEAEAVAGARHIAEAREIHVRAANPQPVGRDAVEHPQPGRAGHLRIDVVDQPGVGTWNLDSGEVHEIAPDQQALVARLQQPAGMTRRMSGLQDRGHAGHRLAVADHAHARTVRAGGDAGLGDVAADALVARARLVAIEPEARLLLMQDDFGVWIDRPARVVDQSVRMIGMQMGEEDRADPVGSDAGRAQVLGHAPERRAHRVAGAGVDQRVLAFDLEQEGVDRDMHRVADLLARQPLLLGPVELEHDVERRLQHAVADGGDFDVADRSGRSHRYCTWSISGRRAVRGSSPRR